MCLVEKLIKMDPVFEELLSVLILQNKDSYLCRKSRWKSSPDLAL